MNVCRRVIVLLCLILAGTIAPIAAHAEATPVAAVSSSPVAGAVASPAPVLNLTVKSQSADSDFPKGITFTLDFTSPEPIGRAELFYSYDGDETLNLITADTPKAGATEVSAFLDLQLYYLPPGLDLDYFWRITGVDGAVMETQPGTVTWLDSRFTWTTIESKNVQVSTYDGDAKFAQQILDSAQTAVEKLENDFGVTITHRIRIWSYTSADDFSGTQAPNSVQWEAGIAYPDLHLILAVLPTGNTEEVGRVVPHEITHQVIHQAIANPFSTLPTWLDEGLAVSYQLNGNDTFQAMVQTAADKGQLYSIRALDSGFPYDGDGVALSYAESYSIVQFIKSHWSMDTLVSFVLAFRDGISADQAAKQTLGVDLDGLDSLWKASLNYKGNTGVVGATSRDSGGSGWGELLASGALIWLFAALLLLLIAARAVRAMRRNAHEDHAWEIAW